MKPPRAPINTAAKVTKTREFLGLDKPGLALALRMRGKHAGRNTVHGWETDKPIPGPVQLALEYLIQKASKGAGGKTT